MHSPFTPSEAVRRAIQFAGGQAALARAVGVKPQAVHQWKQGRVPAERVIAIERATQGTVTRAMLRPDLWSEANGGPAPATASQPGGVAA